MQIRAALRALLTTALAAASFTACVRDPAKDAPKAGAAPPAPPAAASAPDAGGGVRYVLDPAASRLGWTASKVTRTHVGGFRTFRGAVTMAGGAVENGRVEIEIDVDSIFTDSDRLVGHLKSPDFFDVAQHPKATFASTAITAGGADGATHTVTGNLTLRGVTRAISFPATITVAEGRVTAKSRFSLNRQDFGVAYRGAPDDLVRDDVLVEWEIVANEG